MLASPAVNSATFQVTTPSDEEIRMTRLFDAPPALVYEAMTRPERIREWWGRLGEGYSVPVCEVDLRVGGKWKFVNRHPKEVRDMVVATGMSKGAGISYDRLDDLVRRLQA